MFLNSFDARFTHDHARSRTKCSIILPENLNEVLNISQSESFNCEWFFFTVSGPPALSICKIGFVKFVNKKGRGEKMFILLEYLNRNNYGISNFSFG